MPYKEISGNIFNSNAMTIVNTVNCIGAMGKGIALEFKLRFPEMFDEYKKICDQKKLKPGQILPYRKSKPWILNFAIKDDWHHPSKIEWIESALIKFKENYKKMGITSIAFPWMGAMNGGIPLNDIKEITRKYLKQINDIDVEVYTFDPDETDPLFKKLTTLINHSNININEISKISKIQKRFWEKILNVFLESPPKSLYRLINLSIDGKKIFGKVTTEKLYYFLSHMKSVDSLKQRSLF